MNENTIKLFLKAKRLFFIFQIVMILKIIKKHPAFTSSAPKSPEGDFLFNFIVQIRKENGCPMEFSPQTSKIHMRIEVYY